MANALTRRECCGYNRTWAQPMMVRYEVTVGLYEYLMYVLYSRYIAPTSMVQAYRGGEKGPQGSGTKT
eukprot:6011377-Prymnesium_polylepis.2